MFIGDFDIRSGLFHTVFNRTVENCHTLFIIGSLRGRLLVGKLLESRVVIRML